MKNLALLVLLPPCHPHCPPVLLPTYFNLNLNSNSPPQHPVNLATMVQRTMAEAHRQSRWTVKSYTSAAMRTAVQTQTTMMMAARRRTAASRPSVAYRCRSSTHQMTVASPCQRVQLILPSIPLEQTVAVLPCSLRCQTVSLHPAWK